MKEEYHVFGKGISSSDKKRFVRSLYELKKQRSQPLEHEGEKTPQERHAVSLVNIHLHEACRKLGLDDCQVISPNRLYFLNAVTFQKVAHTDRYAEGVYDSAAGEQLFFDRDKLTSPLHMYSTLLHESLHAVSYKKFFFHIRENKAIRALVTRTGYFTVNQLDESIQHFRHFNEAIVERMTLELLTEHKKDISEQLNVSESDWSELEISYQFSRNILDSIIKKIAKRKRESPEDVWDRMKRGLFTGEMMHLRDIEETFGKGSLRILALLDEEGRGLHTQVDFQAHDELLEAIADYFKAPSQRKRDIQMMVIRQIYDDLQKKGK